MKSGCLTTGILALALAHAHAEGTNGLSMVGRVLDLNDRQVKNAHEILVTISNSAPEEVWLAHRFLDYRIMLIAEDGSVLVPSQYPKADDQASRTEFAKKAGRAGDHSGKIAAHGTSGGILRLEEHFRQPIPTGTYWVVVTRVVRLWSDPLLTAPPVKLKIE